MPDQFARTRLLIKEEGIQRLKDSSVLLFGLGGVGGACLLTLARAGIGKMTIVDHDTVSLSNINRQYLADHSTLGKKKCGVGAEAVQRINPECEVTPLDLFYLPGEENPIDFSSFDYVIDAIDTLKAKVGIIEECYRKNVPVISALGCGNRLDPSKLKVGDIFETSYDPLARNLRKQLRTLGIPSLKCVYSTEIPIPAQAGEEIPQNGKKAVPGSSPFVPPAAGILLAYAVVNDLLKKKE